MKVLQSFFIVFLAMLLLTIQNTINSYAAEGIDARGNVVHGANAGGYGNHGNTDLTGQTNSIMGINNNAIGNVAGNDLNGVYNNAIGIAAGENLYGNFNNAIGNSAGHSLGRGIVPQRSTFNNAIGGWAGQNLNGSHNNAIGNRAGQNLNGNENNAIGHAAGRYLRGDNNIIIGNQQGITNNPNTPINNSIAIGHTSTAGSGSVAIGQNTNATEPNSLALGSGSSTTMNQQNASAAWQTTTINGVTFNEGTDATGEANLGNRIVTGVADGRITQGSADAVNGNQLHTLATAVNTSGAQINTNTSNIAVNRHDINTNTSNIAVNRHDINTNTKNIAVNRHDINTNTSNIAVNRHDINTNTSNIAENRQYIGENRNYINHLESEVGNLREESRNGIALALALHAPVLMRDRTHALNMSLGEFHGTGALGISYSQVIYQSKTNDWETIVDLGVGTDLELEEVGGRVGVSFQW